MHLATTSTFPAELGDRAEELGAAPGVAIVVN